MLNYDKNLARVFKLVGKPTASEAARQKAKCFFENIRKEIVDRDFSQLLKTSFEALLSLSDKNSRLPAKELLTLVQKLNDQALPNTSEVIFISLGDSLKSLDVESATKFAPTARSIATWLKFSEYGKKQFGQNLFANVPATYSSAACEWHFQKGNLRESLPLLELLLSRLQRPKHLSSWDDLLNTTLQRDSRGILLELSMLHYPPSHEKIQTLVDLVVSSHALLKASTETLPSLLTKKSLSGKTAEFVKQLFAGVNATAGNQRRFASAALAC